MLGELFDPKAELLIHERLRPHWAQAGAIVFVTIRTADSIPREVILRWEREKRDWLRHVLHRRESAAKTEDSAATTGEQLNARFRELLNENSQIALLRDLLTEKERQEFDRHFNRCREVKLDECLGACVFKRPELAQIVANSLLYFDGIRYRMGDFVIMPNHVHLLAAFASPESMEKQFASWTHYTAFRINQMTGLRGHFWQQEPFDHLVRTVDQYEYLRNYIAKNPEEAFLKKGEYYYRRYEE